MIARCLRTSTEPGLSRASRHAGGNLPPAFLLSVSDARRPILARGARLSTKREGSLSDEHERHVGDGLPTGARKLPAPDRTFDASGEPWITLGSSRHGHRSNVTGSVDRDGCADL